MVVRLTVDVFRHPGIGHDGNGVLAKSQQTAHGIAHLVGAGGAVEAHHVHRQSGEGDEGGFHVGATEHVTVGFQGDLGLDGDADV